MGAKKSDCAVGLVILARMERRTMERFDIEQVIRILGLEMRAEQADDGRDFDVACRFALEKMKKCKEYEDAAEQGLLLRLPAPLNGVDSFSLNGKEIWKRIPCHCKDCSHWVDGCAGCTEHVKLCDVGNYMVGENGYCLYAEKKLKEMEEK